MSKQPKKTAQVKKNSEAEVGSNAITRIFGRKAPERRVVRLKMRKRQRGSLKNRGKSMPEATSKSKGSKEKTTVKSNIIPGDGAKKNKEEKKKLLKWSA